MKFLGLFILYICVALPSASAKTPDYERLDPSCSSCMAIDKLLTEHSGTLGPDKKLAIALKIAKVIKAVNLKGLPKGSREQMRPIYASIKATIEVLDDDFDSETVVQLMKLRAQAPNTFDYVFWRFPIGNQKRIVERMKAAKADRVSDKDAPVAKAIEPN